MSKILKPCPLPKCGKAAVATDTGIMAKCSSTECSMGITFILMEDWQALLRSSEVGEGPMWKETADYRAKCLGVVMQYFALDRGDLSLLDYIKAGMQSLHENRNLRERKLTAETMLCELCEARDKLPFSRWCDSCWELEEAFERLTSISPGAAVTWAQHAVYKAVAEIDVGDHTTEDEDIGDLRGKVTRNGEGGKND